MGTFHHDRHELHGITVVVETTGSDMYIGRCDDIDARGVILRDADVHREDDPASAGKTRAEFLDHARSFGVWPNLKRIRVPAESVLEIRRLGEI